MANSRHFPRQKLSHSQKDKKWRERCVDSGEDLAIFRDSGVRRSYRNKKANYNLYSDILDERDFTGTLNNLGLQSVSRPARMQHYPVANPKIDRLVGEESRMPFEFTVRVANDSAISQKEEEKKEQLKETIINSIKSQDKTPQQIKEELEEEKKYLDYRFQDVRERRATHILHHLNRKLELAAIFNDGFKDALIAGEEIYQTDIIAGEPVLFRLNPLNVHTVRSGESNRIEDSDIIVIDGYRPPGEVIDDYHDWLTDEQVKFLDNEYIGGHSVSNNGIDIGDQHQPIIMDELIDETAVQNSYDFGNAYDGEGNIRVLKVYWKSLRKVKKLTYFDDQGNEQVEIVDENYKPKEDQGEKAESIWINEWWEGHKIGGSEDGNAIYTKIQPRPIQFRQMENPSKCSPGIIGRAYNTNSNEAVSLMDRMKPYQYLYDIFMFRTEEAFAKSYGKIMELPLHKVPDDWDMDKWLSFLHSSNIAVVDQFKEGEKGAAQGKLAGNMQQGNNVWDLEMGNYIQQHISMLDYLEQQMGEISGITEAREGKTESREPAQNVQSSIVQSSHITEYWFKEHDRVKEKAMEQLLETAKAAYRGRNKKVQYILDDQTTALFELDGDQFAEQDYGVFISNSTKDQKLIDDLKSLSQSMIQNDKMDVSSIIDVYMSESVSTIRNKIQDQEEESKREAQRERQSKMEQIQREKDLEQRNNQREQQLEKYKADLEAQVDREKMVNEQLIAKIKEMSDAAKSDADSEENQAIEWEKVQQDWEKLQQDWEELRKNHQLEEEQNEIEKKKISSETYNS